MMTPQLESGPHKFFAVDEIVIQGVAELCTTEIQIDIGHHHRRCKPENNHQLHFS